MVTEIAEAPPWITDALISYTRESWSTSLGRSVEVDEAVEILLNVKRLTEVLMDIANDVDEVNN